MTRTEAIAIITATLPALDEAQATKLAELAQSLAQSPPPLKLTDEDHAGIARAREDFAIGRTYSSTEARALSAELSTKRRASKSA